MLAQPLRQRCSRRRSALASRALINTETPALDIFASSRKGALRARPSRPTI